MQRLRRALVHLRSRFQYGQDVTLGLANNWESDGVDMLAANGESAISTEQIATLQPDVIIGDSYFHESVASAIALGIPFIDVTGSVPVPGIHSLGVDDVAVGRMAAEYLLPFGAHSYAFVGYDDQGYSDGRREGYLQALGRQTANTYETPLATAVIGSPDRRLVAFLRQLETPIAAFACSDLRAASVVTAARQVGLRIGEDLHLLGVDVDGSLAALMGRRLPSVDQGAWFIGWEAAQLARRLMEAPDLPPVCERIPPLQVVTPGGSETVALTDPIVADFVQRLEEGMAEAGCVAAALEALPLSRRAIEHRVRKAFGVSPLRLFQRKRFERALELLADPSLRFHEIGSQIGFEFQTDFSRFIRRESGNSPSVLRRRLLRRS